MLIDRANRRVLERVKVRGQTASDYSGRHRTTHAPRARAGSAASARCGAAWCGAAWPISRRNPSAESAGFANRSPWVASPVIKPRELMALV
jgi:hypothetical protein